MTNEPVLIERTLNAPVQTVWHAITDKDQMKEWYFDLTAFEPKIGFTFQFEGGKDDQKYVHTCIITEVIPEKKLAYSWKYEGFEGKSLVTFEIFDENSSTRLRLTHTGLETFPSDNPNFAKENFLAGWNHIIGSSLPNFLEQNPQL